MTHNKYRDAKLSIYEKLEAGVITESQKDDLLEMLESEKAKSELSADDIEKFFDNLEDMFPDLKDDIKKLSKKIEKSGKSDDEDDDESDEDDDKKPDKDDEEAPVSEAVLELLDLIESL